MADTSEKTDVADSPPAKEALQAASPASSSVVEAGSGINEKALVRKLDRKLLPPVTLLYLLSFLDRSNGISLWI